MVLFLPAALTTDAMTEAHGQLLTGHDGIYKTKERLMQCFYWPGMDADILKTLGLFRYNRKGNPESIKKAEEAEIIKQDTLSEEEYHRLGGLSHGCRQSWDLKMREEKGPGRKINGLFFELTITHNQPRLCLSFEGVSD